jgi:hypothetical protein
MRLNFRTIDFKKQACRITLALMFGLAVSGTALADDNTFVQGTTVNGLGISGMTVEEATARIQEFYSSQYQLTIKEKGGVKETIGGSDIGFSVGIPEGYLEGILSKQNEEGRISGPDVDSKFRVEMANTYSEEALINKINSLNCISGSSIVTTADAYITEYRDGQPFEIIKEVNGNNVDPEKVTAAVTQAVASGATEVDLQTANCYYKPAITSDNAELNDLCNTLNQCRNMTITYVIGEAKETLAASEICSWLQGTQDGEIQVNREKASAYIASLASRYDTVGTERSFHTADGRDITISGGAYGWKINQTAETDALIGMIRTGQTQEREPAYSSTALSRTEPEWGTTYAEVDLTNQHVYMTVDGQVVWDAPCVTGNLSKSYDTPAGLYSLTYKERDRVLRGKKQEDGTYEYESPVSYWMPFNGGIGFHDANWRSRFGGDIYKTAGSHGCVNLPPEKAALLYDYVYTGMPVICYN